MGSKILLVLFTLAFIICSIWAYNTNYDYEPIVGIIGSVASIVGLLIKDKVVQGRVNSKAQKVNIKGNNIIHGNEITNSTISINQRKVTKKGKKQK